MTDQQIDTLDSVLTNLGLTSTKVSAEDELYLHLTEGKNPHVHNLRYWLRYEMSRYAQMKRLNIKVVRDIVKDGKQVIAQLTNLEYARVAIVYYLYTYHTVRMEARENRPATDPWALADRLLACGDMIEQVEKLGSERLTTKAT